MADWFLWASYLGTTLFVAALVPQAVRTWRLGRADDISVLFLVTVVLASACMLAYGISLRNWVFCTGFVANIVVWGYVMKVRLWPRPMASEPQ